MGDPSSNMDELLKTYARKRREEGGEPPPLHSATRHQLQEEVRRTYATPEPAPRPWYAALSAFFARPAWAGAVALAAVTVGLFVALWPQTQLPPAPVVVQKPAPAKPLAERESLDRKSLAKYGMASAGESARPSASTKGALTRTEPFPAEEAPHKDEVALLARAPAPKPAALTTAAPLPSVALEASGAKEGATSAKMAAAETLGRGGRPSPPSTDMLTDETRNQRPGDQPSPARDGTGMADQKEELFFAAGNAALQNARFLNQSPARLPSVAEPVRRSLGEGGGAAGSGGAGPVPPSRDAKGGANRPAVSALLQSFRMTRVGNAVVLVDADGSVYRGTIEMAGLADTDKLAESNTKLKQDRATLQTETKARAMRGSRTGAQGFSFRVIGTNLTLRQEIEITANYALEGAEVTKSQASSGSATASNQAANDFEYQENRARAQQQNVQVPRGRIQGRARLADKSEVELDAVSAPAP